MSCLLSGQLGFECRRRCRLRDRRRSAVHSLLVSHGQVSGRRRLCRWGMYVDEWSARVCCKMLVSAEANRKIIRTCNRRGIRDRRVDSLPCLRRPHIPLDIQHILLVGPYTSSIRFPCLRSSRVLAVELGLLVLAKDQYWILKDLLVREWLMWCVIVDEVVMAMRFVEVKVSLSMDLSFLVRSSDAVSVSHSLKLESSDMFAQVVSQQQTLVLSNDVGECVI